MTSSDNLFRQINNAVLDLQASDFQSYARPIKSLARLLQDPALDSINKGLVAGLELELFLSESIKSQGGMIGTARLAWPEEPERCLGLVLLLIWKFASEPDFMFEFGHTFRNPADDNSICARL